MFKLIMWLQLYPWDLTDATFEQSVLKDDGIWVVLFSAQWCGHCSHLKPQFEQAASELQPYSVKFGHVDQQKNQKLINDYVVNHQTHMVSYPKLISFKGGVRADLPSNARTATAIYNWVVDYYKLNSQGEYPEDVEDQKQQDHSHEGHDHQHQEEEPLEQL